MASDETTDAGRRSTRRVCVRCPGCGEAVPCTRAGYPRPARCPACATVLWCTKKIERGVVVLNAIPQPKAEIADLARVGQSLQCSGKVGGVILNLSDLETVNSSFVAGLLVLRRLIEAAGGNLVLCEVHPHVHAILQRLKLHTLFVIRSREQDALRPA